MVDVAEVKCDHPTSTKDGFIEVSNFRGSYVYGSRATYHCNPGYILWGNSTRWEEFLNNDTDTTHLACCRLCDSSGVWTGAAPSCQLISCGDPPMLPHSAVALLNGTTQWRALALYSCLPGHDPAPGKTLCQQRVCYVGGFILHCQPSKAPTQWRWRLCHSPPPGRASLAAQLLGLAL